MTQASKQKSVLITGGAKRIGEAMAIHLAHQEYDIALHYNQSSVKAKALAKRIEALGQRCEIFSCDLNNDKDFSSLIANVKKKFKTLDLLIHNASTFKPSQFQKSTLKHFDLNFNVHVRAPIQITRDFVKTYKKGHVITILDTHVTDNNSQHFDYLLSKKTLTEFTRMAAVDLAPHFRVNAIAPGLILPPEDAKTGHLERRAKDIPMKRKGSVENILQSLDALIQNTYLTGQILYTDGGEHLI